MGTSALDMVEDGEGDEIEHATLKSSNKSVFVGDPETMEEEVRGNPSLDVFWLILALLYHRCHIDRVAPGRSTNHGRFLVLIDKGADAVWISSATSSLLSRFSGAGR